MTRIEVSRRADADIDEIAAYLVDEADDVVALRFLSALEDAWERIVEHPSSGARVLSDNAAVAELRYRQVRGFEDYLVFYATKVDLVLIVRVLHGARDLPPVVVEPSP